MSTQNRQWILNTRPLGRLTGGKFRWNEAPVPQPSDGQALVRNLWLSVGPAQRTWMARDSYKPAVPFGDVMQSFAVGQVLESRHPDFKPGDLVQGEFGWQDHAATDGKSFGGMHKLQGQPRIVEKGAAGVAIRCRGRCGSATRPTSHVPPCFSLPKKHRSSPGRYLLSTEARPPANSQRSTA